MIDHTTLIWTFRALGIKKCMWKFYVATENSELSEISYDNGIFMYCHCKGKFRQNGNPRVQKVRKCVNEYYIYILLYKSIIKW